MIVQALKKFNLDVFNLDELVELSAGAENILEHYAALAIPVPEWIQDASRSIRREINRRQDDDRQLALKNLKARRASLMTADEKRSKIDREIEALEKQAAAV